MRLLIDEMYPQAIAEQLRRRGHDVSAVTERPELRNMADAEVFEAAQREARALVTENARDYIPIVGGYASHGRAHFGLILVDPAKYPRGAPRTIGRMVTALEGTLEEHPGEQPESLILWL